LAVILAGWWTTKNLRTGAREVHSAIDRLRAETQEAIGQLEDASTSAVTRIRLSADEAQGTQPQSDLQSSRTTMSEDEVIRGLESLTPDNDQTRHTKWWQPIVDMKFDDPSQPSPRLYWKNNVRTPLPWPSTWLTGYTVGGDTGSVGVALSGKANEIDALWKAIQPSLRRLSRALPEGTSFEPGRFGISWSQPRALFKSDDEQREWLRSNLNAFQKALAPELRKLRDAASNPKLI